MSIYVGLDVGRAGKDFTALTLTELRDGKLHVIESVAAPDMASLTREVVATANITLLLALLISSIERHTDDG